MADAETHQPSRRRFSDLSELGLIALNVLLYLILASAAVETFWSRASTRWWVVAVVAVYLGVSAALWWFRAPMFTRLDWDRKAIISCFVFLALLAVTAWLPGGLIHGVTFFTLSTSTLVSLVTAVAVGFSGLILFRSNARFPVGRWLIAAATVYGLFAFVWGIYFGSPYPALFHGKSFWSWLPRALQGAFIGAVILIPAALIHEVFILLRRGRTVRFDHGRVQQVLALGLGLAVALSGLITQARFDSSQPSAMQISEPANRTLPSALAAAREIPSLAARLQNDPALLLRYAVEQIVLEPYEGSLRGPRGVILAGAANSTDMALFIREFIRTSDRSARTRFAFATLPEEKARAILTSAEERRSRTRSKQFLEARDGGHVSTVELESRLKEKGLEDVTPVLLRSISVTRTQLEKVGVRATWLDRTLADNGVSLGSLRLPPAAQLEATRAHVWLQMLSGSKWVDLDPTVPDPAPGKRHVEPQRTDGELPEDLHHELRIGLRLEEIKDGQLGSRRLLSMKARTAELIGASITYVHAEAVGLGSLVVNKDPKLLTPLLLIGGQVFPGEPFPEPANPGEDRVPSAGQVAGDGVGGFLRSRPIEKRTESAASTAAQPAALWLEVALVRRGQESEKHERPIFDRISSVDRASGHVSSAKLGAARSIYQVNDPFSTIWSIATWVGEKVHAAVPPEEKRSQPLDDESREFIAALEELGVFQRSYYVLHQALLRAVAGDNQFFVPAGVNVSLMATSVRPVGQSEKVGFAFDLIRSRAATLASASTAGTASEGVVWGVSAQLAEGLLLQLARLQESVDALAPDIDSIFEQARAAGISFLVLKPGDGASVDAIGADREARTRLRERLKQGFGALVPERAPRVQGKRFIGWWLIDEQGGRVIDELQSGGHTATTESTQVTGDTRKQTAAARQGFIPRLWRGVKRTGGQVMCVLIISSPAAVAMSDGVITVPEMNDIVEIFQGLAAGECRRKATMSEYLKTPGTF